MGKLASWGDLFPLLTVDLSSPPRIIGPVVLSLRFVAPAENVDAEARDRRRGRTERERGAEREPNAYRE